MPDRSILKRLTAALAVTLTAAAGLWAAEAVASSGTGVPPSSKQTSASAVTAAEYAYADELAAEAEASGVSQEIVRAAPGVIRVGLVLLSPHSPEIAYANETVAWFETHLKARVQTQTLTIESSVRAVKEGRIDVLLSTAGFFERYRAMGLTPVATMASPHSADPNRSTAGVFFTLAGRDDLQTIDDVKGRSIAATMVQSFGSWDVIRGEVIERGYSQEGFLAKVQFVGMPMERVVESVLHGRTEAGVVRACYLEDLKARGFPGVDRLKVLDQQPENVLACKHSTREYPGFTLSVTRAASPEVARFVAASLFSMPYSDDGYFWSVASDFNAVRALYRTLREGPYAYLRGWTFSKFWETYWQYLMIFLLLVAGVIFHSVRSEWLVRERTQELLGMVRQKEALEKKAAEREASLEALRRVSAVQQLSSMIAHELKQPMSAIQYFGQSLLSRMDKGTADAKTVRHVVGRMLDINRRSQAIVDQVRDYARHNVKREPVNLSPVVTHAVAMVKKKAKVPVEAIIAPGVTLRANALEVELAVSNLLKNAVAAAAENPEGRVNLIFEPFGPKNDGCRLRVSDNGPELTDDEFTALSTPLKTTKSDGLGLGVSIVRLIAENYGGRLLYERREGGGLTAVMTLSNIGKKEEDKA